MLAARVLQAVETAGPDDGPAVAAAADAFRRFLLLAAAVHAWVVVAHAREPMFAELTWWSAVALTGTAALALVPRLATLAARLAFVAMLVRLILVFPDAYNHLVLEAVLTGAAALTRADVPDEQALLLQIVRWVTVVVFAWTGMQKLLHGCWLRGEFLAVAVASNARYAALFTPVMPDEVARLQAIPMQPGAGPFLVDAWWFVALSNVVWIAELVLPALLLIPRTRWLGVAGSVAFLIAVEAVARELVFGLLFANVICLFLPPRTYARAFPVFLGLLLLLLVAEVGLSDVWLN